MLGPSHPFPRILSRDAGWPNLPRFVDRSGLVKATLPTPLGGAVGQAAPETCETRDMHSAGIPPVFFLVWAIACQ
jgi:hypothetical protein